MSLATKVPQVSGYGGLLGETTSTVETFESFTLVRMIFIPIQEGFHLRRIVNKVHAVPFEKLLPLIVTVATDIRGNQSLKTVYCNKLPFLRGNDLCDI